MNRKRLDKEAIKKLTEALIKLKKRLEGLDKYAGLHS